MAAFSLPIATEYSELKDRQIAGGFRSSLYRPMIILARVALEFLLRRARRADTAVLVERAADRLDIEAESSFSEAFRGTSTVCFTGPCHQCHPKGSRNDETLSTLHVDLRGEPRVQLRDLHRRRYAPISFVVHAPTEAVIRATHIVIMSDGVGPS